MFGIEKKITNLLPVFSGELLMLYEYELWLSVGVPLTHVCVIVPKQELHPFSLGSKLNKMEMLWGVKYFPKCQMHDNLIIPGIVPVSQAVTAACRRSRACFRIKAALK